MTNYQENYPRPDMAGGPEAPYASSPSDPYAETTAQMPGPGGQPGRADWKQAPGPYESRPHGGGSQWQNARRPHLQVRSTFLTSEFWVFVIVALGTLIAAAVTDDEGLRGGFGAHDAWKFVTWLAIGYMLSRGLTKLGGNRRDGGAGGTRL